MADAALDPLGLPMRPLALLQLVGPAVAYHVGGILHEAFPDRFAVSENLRRIAESGQPLLVDGKVNPAVADAARGRRPRRCTAEQVRDARADGAGRRRSGSCSTRASSPRRRTSTCA